MDYPDINQRRRLLDHEGPSGSASGVVCRDGFTAREARVACGELGMAGGKVAPYEPEPPTIKGYPRLVTNVKCKGTEAFLTNCTHEQYTPCKSGKAASIICTGGQLRCGDAGCICVCAGVMPSWQRLPALLAIVARLPSCLLLLLPARYLCKSGCWCAGCVACQLPAHGIMHACLHVMVGACSLPACLIVPRLQVGTPHSCHAAPKVTQVRLAGSSSINPKEGRLEVKVGTRWGQVCDLGFGKPSSWGSSSSKPGHLSSIAMPLLAAAAHEWQQLAFLEHVECL